MKVKALAAITVFTLYVVFVPMISNLDKFTTVVHNGIQASVGVFTVCDSGTFYGGGTVVGRNGEILTVSHIIPQDDCKVVVKTAGSADVVGAEIVKIDRTVDLALLSTGIDTAYIAELAPRKLEAGETVFTVGAPGHLQGTVTKGIVSNTEVETKTSPGAIIYDITVLPGSSGGGVFDEYGSLAGVIKATVSSADSKNSLAVGIRRKSIETFLKENKIE